MDTDKHQDPPLDQVGRICLVITYTIDAALAADIITKSERDRIWSAVWSVPAARDMEKFVAQQASEAAHV